MGKNCVPRKMSSCCSSSSSTPSTSLTWKIRRRSRTRTKTTAAAIVRTTTSPFLSQNSNSGWMSTRKRGRDDSDIEEASRLARQRRKEELAAASPAPASSSSAAATAASKSDKRRTGERNKFSDRGFQDDTSGQKKKRSVNVIDKVEDDDVRKQTNARGRRILDSGRKKNNNNDSNHNNSSNRNLQIYSPNRSHHSRRRHHQQQDPIGRKRKKIRPKVLFLKEYSYSTSAKHLLETRRRSVSKPSNTLLDHDDEHEKKKKRQNDDVIIHYSDDRNNIIPFIEESSIKLESCFVGSKDPPPNNYLRTEDDNDDDDRDHGIEDITANLFETQQQADRTSTNLQLVKASGLLNDLRTELKVVDHHRQQHYSVDNETSKSKGISYLPDHEELPGTQDFGQSGDAPATSHHCNLKERAEHSTNMINNDDQRQNDGLIEHKDEFQVNDSSTAHSEASKSHVEDELDEVGTMDQTYLSLPRGNLSYDESKSESDISSSEEKEIKMTYGSPPLTQERRSPIPLGQPSYDEGVLSQKITTWLGQHYSQSSDHNNPDEVRPRRTQEYFKEKPGLDPLTNLKFWENLVEDERKKRKGSYKDKGPIGNAKFQSAIAKLVVAKNRKAKKKRRDKNRLLWLPSILDGGLTGSLV